VNAVIIANKEAKLCNIALNNVLVSKVFERLKKVRINTKKDIIKKYSVV